MEQEQLSTTRMESLERMRYLVLTWPTGDSQDDALVTVSWSVAGHLVVPAVMFPLGLVISISPPNPTKVGVGKQVITKDGSSSATVTYSGLPVIGTY